jgi:UDP-N-acetylmuramyl pentapeptide phosphotransferase/UDP-N-acetylglucosamine-1-phosphate transferase
MLEILIYILFALLLFFIEFFYIKVAKRYGIVDLPNERGSHQTVTIRGGGIIFPFAIILSTIFFKDFPFLLIVALILISIISFWDDIKNVPDYLRFFTQITTVSLILMAFDVYKTWPIWIILIAFILIIGIINAFNFMDGINGITGVYSLVTMFTLLYVNQKVHFTNQSSIIIPIVACLVFLFFNFRKAAKCFAGDIGSISIGFWIVILLLMVIIQTGNLKYILFLSVYGIDTVLTILHRLALKQNIFRAHRLHLFQYMVNELRVKHLIVAILYGIMQAIINIFILNTDYSFINIFLTIIIPLGVIYFYLKFWAKLKITNKAFMDSINN